MHDHLLPTEIEIYYGSINFGGVGKDGGKY